MSKEALAKVVQRAISDAGFRRQLNSDPTGALRGFDLSADELSALRTGNAGRLSSLGIDQRMSKAFVIGGAVGAAGATRMAQSDLSAGSSNVIDDGSGTGSRAVIPNDPDRVITAEVDAGPGGGIKGQVRAGDDYKFVGRQAPEGTAGAARVGDDWKFARSADASGGQATRSAINDDPDGFLAANANAQGSVAPVEGSPEATAADIAAGGGASAARSINDDPDGFLAANANADLSGGTSTGGTAFVDESEAYLSKVGYDASAATSAVTDAHDRGGDNIVTRIDDGASDSSNASAASEQDPDITS